MQPKNDGIKDVETLEELCFPYITKWKNVVEEDSTYQLDSKDYLKAKNEINWLKEYVPQFRQILKLSPSLDRAYIDAALVSLVRLEDIFSRYDFLKI